MRVPWGVALLVATASLLSGCLGDDGADGAPAGYRDGVVFFSEEFTAASFQPAHFRLMVDAGALDIRVELQQDAGGLPDLEVRLTGCGEVELEGSTRWQKGRLCDVPSDTGRRELMVDLVGEETSGAAAKGRLLLRADLPSRVGGGVEVPHATGVVLLDERFTAALGVPATFDVEVPSAARRVLLELDQDSGAIPNLHVELTGCGEADPPGSASPQDIPLCDRPTAGRQTLTVSVNAGLPAGNGRVVLTADLV